MPYDFNAFSPLTNTATEITFTGLNTMAPFNVRIKGSGLAYNPATGVLTGTVTSIERYNGAFVPEVTTLGAGAAVKISTFLQASLQVIADTITAWGIAFDNVNGTFGPGGTLLTLELTSASVVIGYLRLAGTGLTDAGFDSGHITSITHLDATQTAVAGHVKTYAGVGLLAACFDYGLQSTNGGVSGNGEAIYPTIISGNDTITPAAGTNGGVLEGGDGNDTYVLGAGSYSIDDTSGTDTVTSTITRSLATFTSIEKLTLAGAAAINGTGNGLANTITGNAAANTLNGGIDTRIDTLTGGLGNDTYFYRNGDVIVERAGQGTADHVKVIATHALAANANIEFLETTLNSGVGAINLTGNAIGQTITGNNGINVLSGLAGNDTLLGLGSNDTLNGGLGIDKLSGGLGVDTFVFNTALSTTLNRDTITDFFAPQDTIKLENTGVFAALGATLGALGAAKFWASTTGLAHDADDRIIYNTLTGVLTYDSNGSGAGGAVQFAVLTAHPAITKADFVVI